MSSPRTFHTGLLGRDMHVAVTPKQWRRLRKRFDDCLTEWAARHIWEALQ